MLLTRLGPFPMDFSVTRSCFLGGMSFLYNATTAMFVVAAACLPVGNDISGQFRAWHAVAFDLGLLTGYSTGAMWSAATLPCPDVG